MHPNSSWLEVAPMAVVDLPPVLDFPPPTPWPSLMPKSTANSSTSTDGVTAAIIIPVVGIFLFVLACMCSFGHSRANAGADAAAAAPAVAAQSQALPPVPERSVRERKDGRGTAGLPSFTYSQSVKHNVTGSGEEATCSVCLGAFQTGETVRLLPVCLHLYHVECIDPWLDVHPTCPICRSGTDSDPLPPV